MTIKFVIAALRVGYYSLLKRIVDGMIKERKADYVIYGLNGTAMNYYNAFYPMLRYMVVRDVNFIPLEYDYRGDPDEICKKLAAKVDDRYKRVYFVGHSYGGIIARYLVTKYLGDKKKYTVLTVGSPNSGVDIKKERFLDRVLLKIIGLLPGEVTGSKYINYLGLHPLKRAKVVNIAGGKDTLVSSQSIKLDGKSPDYYVLGEDHLSVIYSEQLFSLILKLIQ